MDEMKLKVDTGAVKVTLEDAFGEPIGTFKFVPTDVEMAKRWDEAMDKLNAIEVSEKPTYEESLAFEDELKNVVDYVLNYKASSDIFSVASPLTLNADGQFYFEVVMDGITSVIEQAFKKRVDKKRAKIEKALKKYKG